MFSKLSTPFTTIPFLSDLPSISSREGNIAPIKSLNDVQLGDVSCQCAWNNAIDVPRFDDIPPQLFLHNERDYLDFGIRVITSLG